MHKASKAITQTNQLHILHTAPCASSTLLMCQLLFYPSHVPCTLRMCQLPTIAQHMQLQLYTSDTHCHAFCTFPRLQPLQPQLNQLNIAIQ